MEFLWYLCFSHYLEKQNGNFYIFLLISTHQEVPYLLTSRNNSIQSTVRIVRLSLISGAQATIKGTFPSTITHRIDFSLKPGVHP